LSAVLSSSFSYVDETVFAVEDVGSSTPPPNIKDNAAVKYEDLDRIELILDPIELNKSGASGDAAQSQSLSRGIDEHAGLGLWQRIRRQLRHFRYRVARRISKMFTRRRYRAAAAAAD